jgi:hypothetical protein
MLHLMPAFQLGREYHHELFFVARFSFFHLPAHNQSLLLYISSAKRFYDSARPITAIQCLFEGVTVKAWQGPYLGVGNIDGSTWKPVR